MIQAYVIPGVKCKPRFLNQERINRIIDIVVAYYAQDLEIVKSVSRNRESTWCRHVCMYFLRRRTSLTLDGISRIFSGRDHATTTHSIQTVEYTMKTSEWIRNEISEIGELIDFECY